MLGRMVGEGGRGRGVDREEQASATQEMRTLHHEMGSDVHNTEIFVCLLNPDAVINK